MTPHEGLIIYKIMLSLIEHVKQMVLTKKHLEAISKDPFDLTPDAELPFSEPGTPVRHYEHIQAFMHLCMSGKHRTS